jgi:hypothetical protein
MVHPERELEPMLVSIRGLEPHLEIQSVDLSPSGIGGGGQLDLESRWIPCTSSANDAFSLSTANA